MTEFLIMTNHNIEPNKLDDDNLTVETTDFDITLLVNDEVVLRFTQRGWDALVALVEEKRNVTAD